MKSIVLILALPLAILAADAPKPIFSENFDAAAVGKMPEGFTSFAGDFKIVEEGGKKFIELPGAPLDTFGVLFGPSEKPPLSASAKFFATNVKRKSPAFALSLGGVGGYRVQVSAAKGTLEIFKSDEPRASVPFAWTSGAWTALRLQVREAGGKWIVEGKAWPADGAEPAAWTIKYEAPEAPPQGKAGVWGNPFSGTPIRFDDLVVAPAA
ncbi:MAG: hypothetical protein ABMA13_07815 [Chthoniobacteraceae bacterium]